MRQPLVAGNWKMNGSIENIKELLDGIKQGIIEHSLGEPGLDKSNGVEIVVCPPSIYLGEVHAQIKQSAISLGAQNVSDQTSGAFTGENSVSMLKDYGCKYSIIGHSERRTLYAETDQFIAKKFVAVCEAQLIPIFCIGELLQEREAGKTEDIVSRQIDAVLDVVDINAFKNAVIAYEPVWAIGTGKTATPDQAQEVHAFIRKKLSDLDADTGAQVQILYGGSMNASNAAELLGMPDIDGGLIGGASLKPTDFLAICNAANATVN